MALILSNAGGAGAGKVLETKSFSITINQSSTGQTSVTLDETYTGAKYAIEVTSNFNDAAFVGIESVTGTTVAIKGRNVYSSAVTITGNVIVFE